MAQDGGILLRHLLCHLFRNFWKTGKEVFNFIFTFLGGRGGFGYFLMGGARPVNGLASQRVYRAASDLISRISLYMTKTKRALPLQCWWTWTTLRNSSSSSSSITKPTRPPRWPASSARRSSSPPTGSDWPCTSW